MEKKAFLLQRIKEFGSLIEQMFISNDRQLISQTFAQHFVDDTFKTRNSLISFTDFLMNPERDKEMFVLL